MGRFVVDAVNPTSPEQGGTDFNFLLLALFFVLFVFRFLRLFVGIWANLTCKPIPIPAFPNYIPSRDVTVIVPTVYKKPQELLECLQRIHRCGPKAVFVVLLETHLEHVRNLISSNGLDAFVVCKGVKKLGKRTQLLTALQSPELRTKLVVFADDDVFWPTNYLENMVASFENPKVGAAGTCQRTRRTAGSSWYPTNFWNILGISYLERRVFNNLTTNFIDGSISTLSGRSSCWRTEILQCEEFYTYFTTDSWRGKLLNSDDDKCLTRYAYSHGWDILINTAVCLETTQEESSAYIHQCLRWARARYRGNMTVMGKETYWRSRKYAWGTYVIYVSMLQNPSLLIDLGFAYLLTLIVAPCEPATRCLCYTLLGLWLLLSKVVRLIPHMLRHPSDLVWLPALIAFGYYHGLLNVYAMCTLTQTAWGGKDLNALSKAKPETDESTPLICDPATTPK